MCPLDHRPVDAAAPVPRSAPEPAGVGLVPADGERPAASPDLAGFGLRNPDLAGAVPERLDAILDRAPPGEGLIALVQRLQEDLGYLPRNALEHLARRTGIPLARIYGVVTFYNSFNLRPRGRYVIRVCEGTACHVSGGPRITESIGTLLSIAPGDTTADARFTLEKVACLGCCSLAPVMTINQETHGRLDHRRATAIVEAMSDAMAGPDRPEAPGQPRAPERKDEPGDRRPR